jgi:hypothetical protein
MDVPEGDGAAAAEILAGDAPSIASPALNRPPPPQKRSRKGQGKVQLAEAAIAAAQDLLPPTAIEPPKRRGRPSKTGESAAPAARRPIKHVPTHKQVREPIVISDSASDNDIPELSINMEDHAAEAVAVAGEESAEFWTRCPDAGFDPPFDQNKYKKASGHTLGEFAHEKEAAYFASLFFTPVWWTRVVIETNKYMCVNGQEESAFTNVGELRQLIGILMIHAHFKLPSIAMHWEACGSYMPHLWRPTFNHIMTLKRYQHLMKHLHFVDDNHDLPVSNPNRDPCFKFRWVLDDLNLKCKSYWCLGKHVSADEGLWVVHSACPLISFCPKPGGSYGVLARMTACAEKFFVYHIHIQDKQTRTLAETLACMCVGLKAGQIIYVDRYYTTMDAVVAVHNKGLGIVATCTDLRFPPAVSQFDIGIADPRGTFITCKKGPICAIKWRDNDVVKCLCNVYGSDPVTVSRMMPNGVKRDVPCPKSMLMFGKMMQGVDRNDQLHSKFYGTAMSSRVKKWTVRVFLSLVDIALANAFILYNDSRTATGSSLGHSDFWIDVADSFIGIPKVLPRSGIIPHRLLKFAEGAVVKGSGASCFRQCVVCALKGQRSRTNYGCSTCKVPLHPECSVDWAHTANPADKQPLVFHAYRFA